MAVQKPQRTSNQAAQSTPPQQPANPTPSQNLSGAMSDAQTSVNNMVNYAQHTAIELIHNAYDQRQSLVDQASDAVVAAFHPESLNADIASAAVGKLAQLQRSNLSSFSWGVVPALPSVQHCSSISLQHLYPASKDRLTQRQLAQGLDGANQS